MSMNAHDLAERITALDWSACSLQHQLAVSAAVETLRGEPLYVQVVGRAKRNLPEPVFVPSLDNVIAHPALARTHRTVALVTLDTNHTFASAGFSGGCAGDSWEWIVSTVAAELGCHVDQVGCVEGSEDGAQGTGDFVTVDGLPVYLIECG
jgi:hypothetical protein